MNWGSSSKDSWAGTLGSMEMGSESSLVYQLAWCHLKAHRDALE